MNTQIFDNSKCHNYRKKKNQKPFTKLARDVVKIVKMLKLSSDIFHMPKNAKMLMGRGTKP